MLAGTTAGALRLPSKSSAVRAGVRRSRGSERAAPRSNQSFAHDRVRSGVHSALLAWPETVITVNLAPAALRKEGSGFDLAIALTLLAASD